MLDDTQWPATSALIDDACGTTGNKLAVAEGFGGDARVLYAGFYDRGVRRQELERTYFRVYHPYDERIPRLRLLPDSQLVHVTDLYTREELKTSAAYNEGLRLGGSQNSLNVRLDGPNASRIVWSLCLANGNIWQSEQTGMIERLLPHLRQFVHVQQALSNAHALWRHPQRSA